LRFAFRVGSYSAINNVHSDITCWFRAHRNALYAHRFARGTAERDKIICITVQPLMAYLSQLTWTLRVRELVQAHPELCNS